jgi:molybdopterin-containing oxidoreductase family membrane subunit
MFSAIIGGISLTVFASLLAARLSDKANIDTQVLDKLVRFVGWSLVIYLYVRFWYTFSMTYTYEPGRTEGLALLFSGPLAVNFWLGEIIFGALVPSIILLNKRWSAIPYLRLVALGLVVGGVVAFRWDVNLSGQMIVLQYSLSGLETLYARYVPSLVEIAAGAGIISFGLMAFTLGVRYLNIVDHGVATEQVVAELDPQSALATGD